MKLGKDAYGHEMWAYFQGKNNFEIIERDDGYIDVSDLPKLYFSKYKDWPEYEKRVLRLVKGKVLDIGCGVGRHSLYLQGRGFNVIGIDNSPLAIKICRIKGLKKVRTMSIDQINKFRSNFFDIVIMLGSNFGLLSSFKKAKMLLKVLYKITTPNALIIAESRDPYKTDDPAHLEYHKLNKKRDRMAGQIRIRVRFRKYVGDWFDYLFVSKIEMKQILKNTGWKVKKFISPKYKAQYIAVIEKV